MSDSTMLKGALCLHLTRTHSFTASREIWILINDKFPRLFSCPLLISRRLYPKKKDFFPTDDCCSEQIQLFSGILYTFCE